MGEMWKLEKGAFVDESAAGHRIFWMLFFFLLFFYYYYNGIPLQRVVECVGTYH